MVSGLNPLQSPLLLQHKQKISHGFFTRQGGHSTGLYQSCNLSLSKDDLPENVLRNREKLALFFGQSPQHLYFINQVHHNKALFVKSPHNDQPLPKADALITTTPGLILCIQTADCVPILLSNATGSLVAAIHGGWRSLLSGVVSNTLALMRQYAQTDLLFQASIGPCIAQESYEVSQEIVDQFMDKDKAFKRFFIPGASPNKYQFDIQGLAYAQLSAQNVKAIEPLHKDTYKNEDLFFSCRRSAHQGHGSFGNQASCIMIK